MNETKMNENKIFVNWDILKHPDKRDTQYVHIIASPSLLYIFLFVLSISYAFIWLSYMKLDMRFTKISMTTEQFRKVLIWHSLEYCRIWGNAIMEYKIFIANFFGYLTQTYRMYRSLLFQYCLPQFLLSHPVRNLPSQKQCTNSYAQWSQCWDDLHS